MRQNVTHLLALFVFFLPSIALALHTPDSGGPASQSAESTRIIVKLKPGVKTAQLPDKQLIIKGSSEFAEIGRKHSVSRQRYMLRDEIRRSVPENFRNILIIEAPAGQDLDMMIHDYEALGIVEYAEADNIYRLCDIPNDPLYPHQWSLNNIGQGYYAVEGYSQIIQYGTDGADIDAHEVFESPPDNTTTTVVAVIDTGIDTEHPDLAGKIWVNQKEIPGNGIDDDHNGYIDDINGYDFSGDILELYPVPDNDPTDTIGHGTHVAGIITAVADNAEGIAGITDNCEVMAVKIFPLAFHSVATEGILYAANTGADVISMSWGGYWYSKIVEDALIYARSKGVILVAASGNSGCARGDCYQYNHYPACYPSVISVGATNSDDEITEFSSFGPHLDLCAPGKDILSLRARDSDMYSDYEPGVHIVEDNYYVANGTSFSCPIVSAVTAYLRVVSPGLSPDMVQSILQTTADDFVDPYHTGRNLPGWDQYSGYGRVNLLNALNAVLSAGVKITSPSSNDIINGTIDIYGMAWGDDFTDYVVEYGQGDDPIEWTEIYTSSVPVDNGLLCQWDTGTLDGKYTIRARSGEANYSMVTVYVCNSTIAQIHHPIDNSDVKNYTNIICTASSPDMSYYILEYSHSSTPDDWTALMTGGLPVFNEEVSSWSVEGMVEGIYNLQLSVYSEHAILASSSVSIAIETYFDGENAWRITPADSIYDIPTYGDIDGDGINEILAGSNNGIKFFDLNGNEILSGIPETPDYHCMFPIAVGNLDGDGIEDFVTLGIDFTETDTTAFLLGFPSGQSNFEVEMEYVPYPAGHMKELLLSYPYLRDINDDGKDEIIVNIPRELLEHEHIYRWDTYTSTGELLYRMYPFSYNSCRYFTLDWESDGIEEIYLVADWIYQYDLDFLLTNGYPGVLGIIRAVELVPYTANEWRILDVSAVDIDHDGRAEMIVFYRTTEDGEDKYWISAYDDDLMLKPNYPFEIEIRGLPRYPSWGDINGDDALELFVVDRDILSSVIRAWNTEGFPLGGDSSNSIFAELPNPGGLNYPIIIDINGDSYPNLVATAFDDAFATYKVERIGAWDREGLMLDEWPIVVIPEISSYRSHYFRVPLTGDINNDGYIDLLTTSGNNELTFINFEGVAYNESASFVPCWRQNRRLNNFGYVSDATFLCGDVDASGIFNLNDIVYLIDSEFKGGPPPISEEAADVDGSGMVDILDIVFMIDFKFKYGPKPLCNYGSAN
jgi:subtilisin family serine protease